MTLYAVRDWNSKYENNRTRELKRMDWVLVPNKQDGDGYTEIVTMQDGAGLFGCWVAILQVASKCNPRGTLIRENREPHTAPSLSRMTHMPASLISRALPVLVNVKWLVSVPYEIPHDGAEKPHLAAVASVPFSSVPISEGNGGVGERGVELPRNFPSTMEDAITQCQIIGADAVFVTTLWNGAMARNGQDALGQPILSWPHYVAKHWPKEQANRFERSQAESKPDFWKNSRELDLVEKEIKSIKGRSTQTSTGFLVQPKDKSNYERLKTRRDELKKMLGLWQA